MPLQQSTTDLRWLFRLARYKISFVSAFLNPFFSIFTFFFFNLSRFDRPVKTLTSWPCPTRMGTWACSIRVASSLHLHLTEKMQVGYLEINGYRLSNCDFSQASSSLCCWFQIEPRFAIGLHIKMPYSTSVGLRYNKCWCNSCCCENVADT